jgi:hypothetical protein
MQTPQRQNLFLREPGKAIASSLAARLTAAILIQCEARGPEFLIWFEPRHCAFAIEIFSPLK